MTVSIKPSVMKVCIITMMPLFPAHLSIPIAP